MTTEETLRAERDAFEAALIEQTWQRHREAEKRGDYEARDRHGDKFAQLVRARRERQAREAAVHGTAEGAAHRAVVQK